jgi:hypothetical protein
LREGRKRTQAESAAWRALRPKYYALQGPFLASGYFAEAGKAVASYWSQGLASIGTILTFSCTGAYRIKAVT